MRPFKFITQHAGNKLLNWPIVYLAKYGYCSQKASINFVMDARCDNKLEIIIHCWALCLWGGIFVGMELMWAIFMVLLGWWTPR